MSSAEKELIHASLRQFCSEAHNLLPLRHMSEHNDEARIRDVARQEGDVGCVYFMKRLVEASTISLDRRGVLFSEFCSHLTRLVDKHVAVNQEYKAKWESFLEKRIDSICEDLRTSLQVKLLLNPDMDRQSFDGLVESGKVTATGYFQQMWKIGNQGTFEDQKRKLEQKLSAMHMEILDKRRSKQDVRKAREHGLHQETEIKDEMGVEGEGSNLDLKGEIEDIVDRLKQLSSALNDMCGKLRGQPQGFIEHAINCLTEAKEDLCVVDDARLTGEVDLSRNSSFIEHEHEASQAPQRKRSMENLEQTDNHNYPFPSKTNADNITGKVEWSEPDESNEPLDLKADHKIDDDGGRQIESIGGQRHEAFSLETDPLEPGPGSGIAVQPDEGDHQKNLNEPSPILPCASESESPNDLKASLCLFNVPRKGGCVQLFHAILRGRTIATVEKILNAGANVNAKTKDGYNAAHLVVLSLIDGKLKSWDALAILDLFVTKGFKQMNSKTATGYTPLYMAMEFENLDEEILRCFHENGADFNAVEDEYGNSVLFDAIIRGHKSGLICKILEFGANPKYVNKMGDSALHMAAYSANDSALEVLVDSLDINEVNQDNSNPLGMLFMQNHNHLDYQRCLEISQEKGADLNGSCDKKCPNALVHWLKHGKANPFPALLKTKNRLPITQEIASAVLTTIVEEIEHLRKFLIFSSAPEQHAFVQFTLFLIQEKNAKLSLQCEGKVDKRYLRKLEVYLLTPEFVRNLKTVDYVKWKGSPIKPKRASLTKFDFKTDHGSRIVPVSTEVLLSCLLACGAYKGFVTVCDCLLVTVLVYKVWMEDVADSLTERSKCVVQ